jgi:CheY-like chemotaxis protein/chemotaxis signal transduction protein
VSRPHLLLVDDSAAVLAYETAALTGTYALSTASNGALALEKARELRPAAVLLDLSMPTMDGEEFLARVRDDDALRAVPVIVVSSEAARAEVCVRSGTAAAFVPKPVRAELLREVVARVLDERRRREQRGNLTALLVSVGSIELGLPIESIHRVLPQIATRPLPFGPSYLCELIELDDAPIAVLDLARRLGVEHSARLLDRKLVVVNHAALRFALCVDRVSEPDEFPAAALVDRALLGGDLLPSVLNAVASTPNGSLPIVHPGALLSHATLRQLPAALAAARAAPAGGVPKDAMRIDR